MHRRLLTAIAVLSCIGLAVAGYSLLHNQNFASGEFCTIGETFNCDIVNRGPYSKIYGFPVSAIGVIGYLLLIGVSLLRLNDPKDRGLAVFLALAAGGGFAFSLYLTGIEAFVLNTWCLLCLTSQAVITAIFVLAVWHLIYELRRPLAPVAPNL